MLHSDRPSSVDELGRKPFADKLANVLVRHSDPSPLIVSINGAWGDGKTTLFAFLETAITKHEIAVVRFNPWQFSNESAMLKGFFIELTEVLDAKLYSGSEKLAEWCRKKVGWINSAADAAIGVLPGGDSAKASKEILTNVMSDFWKPQIDELSKRVKTSLETMKKRVIVLIDDPDRLPGEELFALFRLVKLTADFNYVSFVLAMDYQAVASSVGQRFGGEEQGRRFLEKIVQVPLALPSVSPMRLRTFTVQLVNQVLGDYEIDVSDQEGQRFRSLFADAVAPCIKTPRSAKVFANVVRFTLGLLPGEVNVIDVMIMEGIRLHYPLEFERLKAVIMDEESDCGFLDMDREKRHEKNIKRVFELSPDSDGKAKLQAVLAKLFPAHFTSSINDDFWLKEWAMNKRVALEDYAARYFAGCIPPEDIADSFLKQILDSAEKEQSLELDALVKESLSEDKVSLFAKKLRRIEHTFSVTMRRFLALSLARCSALIRVHDTPTGFEYPFGQLAILTSQCLKGLPTQEDQVDFAKELMSSCDSLHWAEELFSWFPHQSKNDARRDEQFTESDSRRVGAVLADRILSKIDEEFWNWSAKTQRDLILHCVWRSQEQHGESIKTWIMIQLKQDKSLLYKFIIYMLTWSYGDKGMSYRWPEDDASTCRTASRFFDIEWLASNYSPTKQHDGDRWRDISPEEAADRLVRLLKQPAETVAAKTEILPSSQ